MSKVRIHLMIVAPSLPFTYGTLGFLEVTWRDCAERAVRAMSEGRWKLSVDQQGVTIASDRFQLTTATPLNDEDLAVEETAFAMAEASQIEAIVAELEMMTRRTYGQYCGLSRAMEVVGERWSLLIVRDLSVSPKSLAQLQQGLPRIPPDTLSARIRELAHTGIVRRLSMAADAPRYELTEFGRELEDILLRFNRWGAQLLGDPRPEEIVTVDSLVVSMRSTFSPEAAQGVHASYEIRVNQDIVFHVQVDDGTMHAAPGPLPGADLVIETGMLLKQMMAGELSAADAIASESVRIVGDPALLQRFTEMFAIPSRPTMSMA
jgi:DNA-binding HxlR family transcriptional regulator